MADNPLTPGAFKTFKRYSVSGAQQECTKRGLNGPRGCDAAKATQEVGVRPCACYTWPFFASE